MHSLDAIRTLFVPTACFLLLHPAAAAAQDAARPRNPLREMNEAFQELSERVSSSVVQIQATGWGPSDDSDRADRGVIVGPVKSIGSGAVIDASGYIVTNAHVLAGAKKIEVTQNERTFEAKLIGTARELDLALIKIQASGLRALPFAGEGHVRQGEIVFAFGNPEGLGNSVTMGVVSAAARQLDPDSPAVYVQTDAPINPGNSGGPLVNLDGELVGINTFILSASGGSQGLGFAIPSTVVAAAFPRLRKYGELRRGHIGVQVQGITPALAAGLGLPRTSGAIVSDVEPESPADKAGLQPQDIITAVNGRQVANVPTFALAMIEAEPDARVSVTVARGSRGRVLTLSMPLSSEPQEDLADVAEGDGELIPKLGIVATDLTPAAASALPRLRVSSGVVVSARIEGTADREVPLTTGDVIHAINGLTVRSVDGLRVLLDGLASNSHVVLQIERDSRFKYVTLDIF